MKAKTYNEGAENERSCWLKHIRMKLKHISAAEPIARALFTQLVLWGSGRAKRCSGKCGGLGRK